MNPPLHDVALHHHQRAISPRWSLLQRANLSLATTLTFGSVGWQLEAAAMPTPPIVVHHTAPAQAIDLATSGDAISETIANQSVELNEFKAESEQTEILISTSNNAIETSISEHEADFIDLELHELGESVVEEFEPNQPISQAPVESAHLESAQLEPASLIVVDEPMMTTETLFDSSVFSNRALNSTSNFAPNFTQNFTIAAPLVAQSVQPDSANPSERDDFSDVSYSSQDLENPLVQVQGVYTLQGNESSARGRVSASYAITPNVMVGGTIDVTTGNAFSDSPEEGIDLNELYLAVSPTELPNLRFVVGMLDLTSYFDRNSFAKDAATHFLNPVFQSNPALTAAGLGSRPAVLMNWSVADPVEVKIAGFSSDRDLGDFSLDGFAGEVGVRLGNLILRGTYITSRDAGQNSGFREIFQIERDEDDFGLDSDDREQAIGVNAEYFIPEIDLGLFARYGWYENLDLDRSSSTFSVGFNLLDLFMEEDRLGLAYGQQLSNSDLRRDEGDDYPDVWELFYDFQITPNLRAGVTVQSINQLSETIGGFRIRADFDSGDFRRLFR